jgi:hypothetical protein
LYPTPGWFRTSCQGGEGSNPDHFEYALGLEEMTGAGTDKGIQTVSLGTGNMAHKNNIW